MVRVHYILYMRSQFNLSNILLKANLPARWIAFAKQVVEDIQTTLAESSLY